MSSLPRRMKAEEFADLKRKQDLTDRTIRALKAAPDGKRYEIMDTQVPGLAVRVSASGKRTFVLIARFPRYAQPARRALGEYVAVNEAQEKHRYMVLSKSEREKETFDAYLVRTYGASTLAGAREKARKWRAMIQSKIDPQVQQERQRQAELRQQRNTFATVAEDFIKDKLPGERKGREVERDIRREFIPAWGKRPIAEVGAQDVRAVVKAAKDRGAPYQAHNLLTTARRLFSWAIDQQVYGLETSPCERLKPKAIIGKKVFRTRVLDDDELRAFWRATRRFNFPYGPLFRMLALTGQRKSEVAEARWSEIDLPRKLWTIPAERMKADAAHVVPLSDYVVAILESLPRFKKGDHVFSTTFGVKPINGFSKAKERLDKRTLRSWRALARARGEDRRGAQIEPWVIHDIRRTMRTGLSALPVPDLVRELVIAHTKPGLHKVYDQHAYLDEKRRALDLWAARLRNIVEPLSSNVVWIDGVRAS
jgi:integrase